MSLIGPSNNSGAPGIKVFNALIPREGPRTIPYNLPFDGSGTQINVDLTQQINLGIISVVQTLYMDALDCTAAVTVTIPGTGVRYRFSPGYQGYVAVLASNPPVFNFASTSTVGAKVQFINVPVAADVWPGNGNPLAITGPLAPSAGGPVTPVATAVIGGIAPWQSASNVTAAAASTPLFPAVAPGARSFVLISAPTAAALIVNRLGGAAGPGLPDCFTIPAGSTYESLPGASVWQAWTYYCATGALEYTALYQMGN